MAVRMITMNGDTPEAFRLALSLFGFPGASGVLDRRGGLAPVTGSADLVATTAMKATVAPFVSWVDGTSGTGQGGYIVVNDSAIELEFEAGEASVARTDRVIAQVRDNAYDSSGAQDARVLVLKGNAGGGATDLPASSELLWEVAVPAGASIGGGGFNVSSARTDKRRWTASNGGLLLVKDAADRGTLTPHEGMQIYRLDDGDRQVYRSGGWVWDSVPRVVVKGSDSAARTTMDVLADSSLAITNVPAGTWDLEVMVRYAAHTAVDMIVGLDLPGSSTANWLIMSKAGQDQPDGQSGTPAWDSLGAASEPRLGGRTTDNTSPMWALIRGTVTTTAAGTIGLRWGAAAAAGANPGTVLKAASRISVTRVG